jgi:hypothetical protein
VDAVKGLHAPELAGKLHRLAFRVHLHPLSPTIQ